MLNTIKIVGTSHISKESIRRINSAIEDFKPDVVAVELDRQRYYALMHGQQRDPVFSDIFKIGVSGFLFLLLGRYVQKKLGASVGMEPGADMKHAINRCREKMLVLALIDRDIQITLQRLSKKFTFRQKMRLLGDLLFSPFSKRRVSIDISKIPKQEIIVQLLGEIKKRYPGIYEVLIEERNKHMAKKIFRMAMEKKRVLAVVGAGHEEGILQELKSLYYSNPLPL